MPRHHLVLLVALFATGVPSTATAQSWVRDQVRDRGDLVLASPDSCGPPTGLKEIVKFTQLTVEGVVSRVESALRPPDEDHLDTDYTLDVTRIFRTDLELSSSRLRPGATTSPSPFVAAAPTSRIGATPLQIRVRALYHGRLTLEGGVVTQHTGFRMLQPGEHVILSAYFSAGVGQWLPFGVFTVQDGRVMHLEGRLQVGDYNSVAAFASALANPPPTTAR